MLEENKARSADGIGPGSPNVENSGVISHEDERLMAELFERFGAVTHDDEKLVLSPDEEFFITELNSLMNIELGDSGLPKLLTLANSKIESAMAKFQAQAKLEFSFFSFVFSEFRKAATEDERALEVIFNLVTRVIRLEKVNAAFELEKADLRALASVDSLTKIFNRGQLEADLPMIFDSTRESDQHLALIIFDLDHFKDVNDTYGHAAGDIVLRAVTKRVSELIRAEDKFYRYGGEEFVILLQTHNRAEVKMIMDKIVHDIAEMPIEIGNNQNIKITISMGGAIKQDALADQNHAGLHKAWVLMQLADEVLYHVKHRANSRNDSFMIGIDQKVDPVAYSEDKIWDRIGKQLSIPSMLKDFFLGIIPKRKPKSKN